MTKYPIKHTMVFEECRCDECDGYGATPVEVIRTRIGYGHAPDCDGTCRSCPVPVEEPYQDFDYDPCEKCQGTGTITKTVTFDLVKDCPECNGRGNIDNGGGVVPHVFCPHCSDNGLPAGKVHRYWTPSEAAEHIKKKTGIDWGYPGPHTVWYRMRHAKDKTWNMGHRHHKGSFFDPAYYECYLYFPGQPAPPADYRPE